MSPINYGALLSFVLITTFTPGPNNISSSSMGILYGYQKSLNYLLGITSGFFGIMLLSGIISRTVYALFPSIEAVLRIAGALYILWLAYKSLKTSYTFDVESSPPLGFANGVIIAGDEPQSLGLRPYPVHDLPGFDHRNLGAADPLRGPAGAGRVFSNLHLGPDRRRDSEIPPSIKDSTTHQCDPGLAARLYSCGGVRVHLGSKSKRVEIFSVD